jgi:hypothetical protein
VKEAIAKCQVCSPVRCVGVIYYCSYWSDLAERSKPSTSGFVTAAELGQLRKRVVRISTGSKQFDTILGG